METLTPLARSRSSLSAASIYRRRPIMILEFGRTMVGLEAQNTTVVASLSPTYLATSHGQFHPNSLFVIIHYIWAVKVDRNETFFC
jgi:hypothetical protein